LRTRLLASLLLVAWWCSRSPAARHISFGGNGRARRGERLAIEAPTVQTTVTRLAVALRQATNASGARATALRVAQTGQALRQIRGTLRLSEARLGQDTAR